MKLRIVFVSLVGVVALICGCRREDVRVYDAPKEKRASRLAAPEGWEEQPAGQMAVSRYGVQGQSGAKAVVTVSALPAHAKSKDELANVNRWRGEVGLPETDVDQLDRERERVQIAGHGAALFDIVGVIDSKKTRILAAMQNRGEAVWFFKMTGDDDLVKAQKDAFLQFAAAYPLPHDHDHDEQGQPAAAPASTTEHATPPPNVSAAPAQSRWKAPAGWTEQPPGAMQDAKFSAAGGKAVVTISIFDKSGGDLRSNVNRWRGQIGLKPSTDEEFAKSVTSLDLPEGKATVVEMTGPQQSLVSVVVARGDRNWYFKLMGEPGAVAAEKNKLIEFVKTTK